MGRLSTRISDAKAERAESPKAPRFAPAGQSTQMIVGADAARDVDILATSANLCELSPPPGLLFGVRAHPGHQRLCRQAAAADARTPLVLQPIGCSGLMAFRSTRFLQRWPAACSTLPSTRNWPGRWPTCQSCPIDVNRASLELLYRVPGLGVRAAKIVAARRYRTSLADVGRLDSIGILPELTIHYRTRLAPRRHA